MLNGTHIAFTPELITDVLREDWGFNCAVFSDCGPIMSHVSMSKRGTISRVRHPNIRNSNKRISPGKLRGHSLKIRRVRPCCS